MNNKIYIGVDPGKEGAIAIYENNEYYIIKFPKIGNDYDMKALKEYFRLIKTQTNKKLHLILEDVKPMQMVKSKGDWELSRGKTLIESLCYFFNFPFTMVSPKEWQKEMHQGIEPVKDKTNRKNKNGEYVYKKNAKETSKLAAQRLFPNIDLRDPDRKTDKAKKIHDGVCDAILMCEYGRRKNL